MYGTLSTPAPAGTPAPVPRAPPKLSKPLTSNAALAFEPFSRPLPAIPVPPKAPAAASSVGQRAEGGTENGASASEGRFFGCGRWRKAPLLLGSLGLQCATCALRLAVVLDISGAFFMGMAVMLGFYACREEAELAFVGYWGMMSGVNGIFDVVKLCDAFAHMHAPLFSISLSLMHNLASCVRLLGPISALVVVPIAWHMSKEEEGGKWACAEDTSLDWAWRLRHGAATSHKKTSNLFHGLYADAQQHRDLIRLGVLCGPNGQRLDYA